MLRLIAPFRVGHSAVGSVADTTRALAPLVMAAWMAGICEAEVAAVPLVSVPVSPRESMPAIAPPVFWLSAVVKYGLPRFFGITKTLRPFLAAPEDPDPDEPPEEEPPPDEQAARARADATTSEEAANGARLSRARMSVVLSWHG